MKTNLSLSERKSVAKPLFKQVKVYAEQNRMLDVSIVMLKIQKLGFSPDEIIKELKKHNCKISKPHIYNYFKLGEVPAKVKSYIRAELIKPSDVLEMMHKHQGPKELIEKVEIKVSEREKEKASKEYKQKVKTLDEQAEKFIKTIEKDGKKIGLPENIILSMKKNVENNVQKSVERVKELIQLTGSRKNSHA